VPGDSNIYVRRAGLTLLKADAAVQAVVDDRVYPPQRPATPQWPFLAWGVPIEGPFGASCLDGSEIDFAVHAYAETTGVDDATVSGEELASALNGLCRTVLNGATLDLTAYGCPYPATAHFTWQQSQVIQDGAEADAFHGIATFRATVAA
jgi:hypothetical protein